MDVVTMFRGNNCSSGFIAHLFRQGGNSPPTGVEHSVPRDIPPDQ